MTILESFFITSLGVIKMSHFFAISLITSSVCPCKTSIDTTGTVSLSDKENFYKSSLSFNNILSLSFPPQKWNPLLAHYRQREFWDNLRLHRFSHISQQLCIGKIAAGLWPYPSDNNFRLHSLFSLQSLTRSNSTFLNYLCELLKKNTFLCKRTIYFSLIHLLDKGIRLFYFVIICWVFSKICSFETKFIKFFSHCSFIILKRGATIRMHTLLPSLSEQKRGTHSYVSD